MLHDMHAQVLRPCLAALPASRGTPSYHACAADHLPDRGAPITVVLAADESLPSIIPLPPGSPIRGVRVVVLRLGIGESRDRGGAQALGLSVSLTNWLPDFQHQAETRSLEARYIV